MAELTQRSVREMTTKTPQKRKRKKTLAALTVALLAPTLVWMVSCTSNTVFKEEKRIIQRGDTLWDLYVENCDGVSWDEWLHKMLDVNEMDSNMHLVPGSEIILLIAE